MPANQTYGKIVVTGDTKDAQKKISDLRKGLARQNKELARSAKQAQAFSRAMRSTALQFVGAAGIVAGIRKANQEFLEFDRGLADIRKTTGLAAEEMQTLAERFNEISSRTAIATKQLTEIGTVAGQLGIKGVANIRRFTEAVALLTQASDVSATNAATSLARLLNLTGQDIQSNIGLVSDALVNLGNNIAATESEILSVSNNLQAYAGTYRLSAQDVLALSGAIAQTGQQAEAAGTAVSKVFKVFEDAISGVNNQMENLVRLTGASRGEFEDLSNVQRLGLFVSGLNTSGDQSRILNQLGLGEIRPARILQALAATPGAINQLSTLAAPENAEGAARREAELRLETASGQFSQSLNDLNLAFSDLGEEVLPAISTAIGFATTAVEAFTKVLQIATGPVKESAQAGASDALIEQERAALPRSDVNKVFRDIFDSTSRAPTALQLGVGTSVFGAGRTGVDILRLEGISRFGTLRTSGGFRANELRDDLLDFIRLEQRSFLVNDLDRFALGASAFDLINSLDSVYALAGISGQQRDFLNRQLNRSGRAGLSFDFEGAESASAFAFSGVQFQRAIGAIDDEQYADRVAQIVIDLADAYNYVFGEIIPPIEANRHTLNLGNSQFATPLTTRNFDYYPVTTSGDLDRVNRARSRQQDIARGAAFQEAEILRLAREALGYTESASRATVELNNGTEIYAKAINDARLATEGLSKELREQSKNAQASQFAGLQFGVGPNPADVQAAFFANRNQQYEDTRTNVDSLVERFQQQTAALQDQFRELGRTWAQSVTGALLGSISAGEALRNILGDILNRIIETQITNRIGDEIGNALFSSGIGSAVSSAFGLQGAADGGFAQIGGLALVGERGPEIVNLPTGSAVYPHGSVPVASQTSLTQNIIVNGVQDPGVVEQTVQRMLPSIAAASKQYIAADAGVNR